MTLTEFQSFVQRNAEWFQGVHPETDATVAEAERHLGRALPASMAWLLTHWGYSDACGVDALDEAVAVTLRAREVLGLPERYLILNDWGDAGVVFLDAETPDQRGEYPVYWTGEHNLAHLASQEPMDDDVDTFPDFPAWVLARLERVVEQG